MSAWRGVLVTDMYAWITSYPLSSPAATNVLLQLYVLVNFLAVSFLAVLCQVFCPWNRSEFIEASGLLTACDQRWSFIDFIEINLNRLHCRVTSLTLSNFVLIGPLVPVRTQRCFIEINFAKLKLCLLINCLFRGDWKCKIWKMQDWILLP